jgi:protein-tyrosine phosphatase
MRNLGSPLVLTSANRSGEPDATTGQEAIAALDQAVELIVDDGPTRYRQASTVVRVASDEWSVLREGVVPTRTLTRLSACVILLVCTGNTCRSPMAEAICKKLLADRLECSVENLPEQGFIVISAGVSAVMGDPAPQEAKLAVAEFGAQLDDHGSQPLTPQLLAQADYVWGMTSGHLRSISMRYPTIPHRAELLSLRAEEVDDPIGGDRELYRDCALQLRSYLEERLTNLAQLRLGKCAWPRRDGGTS